MAPWLHDFLGMSAELSVLWGSAARMPAAWQENLVALVNLPWCLLNIACLGKPKKTPHHICSGAKNYRERLSSQWAGSNLRTISSIDVHDKQLMGCFSVFSCADCVYEPWITSYGYQLWTCTNKYLRCPFKKTKTKLRSYKDLFWNIFSPEFTAAWIPLLIQK